MEQNCSCKLLIRILCVYLVSGDGKMRKKEFYNNIRKKKEKKRDLVRNMGVR